MEKDAIPLCVLSADVGKASHREDKSNAQTGDISPLYGGIQVLPAGGWEPGRFASEWCPCCTAETLYHRDDTLPYIAYVMLIWAAPIPADR